MVNMTLCPPFHYVKRVSGGPGESDRERDREAVDAEEARQREERLRGVTESARAHSYYSSKQVRKTCEFWLLTVWLLAFWLLTVPSTLYIVSKSVLYTPHSVQKCLIRCMQCQKVSY